jgi:hypothetical protein
MFSVEFPVPDKAVVSRTLVPTEHLDQAVPYGTRTNEVLVPMEVVKIILRNAYPTAKSSS